jgi:[acyl-carrier-protein] S-malonyltransferase
VHELSVPVLSNVEADYYPSRQDVKRLLTQQVDHPVRWDEQMGKMLQGGAERFLELGPGRVLMGLMKKISRETPIQSIGNTDNIKNIAESL